MLEFIALMISAVAHARPCIIDNRHRDFVAYDYEFEVDVNSVIRYTEPPPIYNAPQKMFRQAQPLTLPEATDLLTKIFLLMVGLLAIVLIVFLLIRYVKARRRPVEDEAKENPEEMELTNIDD